MNIFTDKGYPDIKAWMAEGIPFVLVIGGRGTGKTYSSLLYAYQSDKTFMFMRTMTDMASEQHTPRFDFDEDVLQRGIRVFASVVYDLMKEH